MYGPGDFGQIGSLPANTTLADVRSPDRIASFSLIEIAERGRDLCELLEVKDERGRRLGALLVCVKGEETTGRLRAHGVSIFTEEEIHG